MIVKEKSVTWEITLDMPDFYGLESVADRIRKLIERNREVLPNISLRGFHLIKETPSREVIK